MDPSAAVYANRHCADMTPSNSLKNSLPGQRGNRSAGRLPTGVLNAFFTYSQ